MGKLAGFLTDPRVTNPAEAPLKRIGHYNEFHPPVDSKERATQGGRCMECGVPFCQSGEMLGGMASGCPLHNLVPEWNDLIYRGDFVSAAQRLAKTNPFPEFTGRVCPALCETACTCGLHGEPVTIKENELFAIEEAFAQGAIKANPPKVRSGKQVAVIGSGPSGLAAAQRLNQRGHSVTVYEKSDRVGGLLMYGIPNMKLEKQFIQRRVDLLMEEGITFVTSTEVGKDISADKLLADYDSVILACGAGKARDLVATGREAKGIYFAVDFLTATTKSLMNSNLTDGKYTSAKGKHVVVIGGGDTGNDCIGTCLRQGCSSVVQFEVNPKPPETRLESNPWPQWPKISKTDYGQEEAAALYGNDPRKYQSTVNEVFTDEDGNVTKVSTIKLDEKRQEIPDSQEIIPCDLLLIAAGFVGCEPQVPEAFGLSLTERSVVATENNTYVTANPKVFAAGDMRRGQSLVVWAIAEGRACAKAVDEFLMGYTNLS